MAMRLVRLAGVGMLCVGLQRTLADVLLGGVQLVLTAASDSSFYRIRLLPGFWWVLACLAGGAVGGLLLRDPRRFHLRSAEAVLAAVAGVVCLAMATQFGSTSALWQAWTPFRQDSMPVWACLTVDLGLVLCGYWLLRSGMPPEERRLAGGVAPVAAERTPGHS